MRISDWSSDVCSSDLQAGVGIVISTSSFTCVVRGLALKLPSICSATWPSRAGPSKHMVLRWNGSTQRNCSDPFQRWTMCFDGPRSEEHTSELQSLMRSSYAVLCLEKQNTQEEKLTHTIKRG